MRRHSALSTGRHGSIALITATFKRADSRGGFLNKQFAIQFQGIYVYTILQANEAINAT